eukprot:7390908-Prymnesium_polylepis.1
MLTGVCSSSTGDSRPSASADLRFDARSAARSSTPACSLALVYILAALPVVPDLNARGMARCAPTATGQERAARAGSIVKLCPPTDPTDAPILS